MPSAIKTLLRAALPMALVPFAMNASAQQPGESVAAKANHCVGCHLIPGYRSVFPEVYPVPKIIGQREDYLIAALRAYKTGIREHPSMQAIAAQLSDDDIIALAKFYAGGAK